MRTRTPTYKFGLLSVLIKMQVHVWHFSRNPCLREMSSTAHNNRCNPFVAAECNVSSTRRCVYAHSWNPMPRASAPTRW